MKAYLNQLYSSQSMGCEKMAFLTGRSGWAAFLICSLFFNSVSIAQNATGD